MKLHTDCSDIFMGISCFEGIFKVQVRKGSDSYQVLCRRVAYALWEPPWEELERWKKVEIIVPLDVGDTSEWSNSFVLVPKATGKVRACLDLAWLNKVLIRPIHRSPTLNDILPRLPGMKYLIFIDVSSGHNNLKLVEKSLYITTFLILLVGTDMDGTHLVWHQLEICFREK